MADYTELGLEKIARQAEEHVRLIRCPRDGVVMRVVSGRAERSSGSGELTQFDGRLPNLHVWRIRSLTLECPACRRRAERVHLGAPAEASPAATRT